MIITLGTTPALQRSMIFSRLQLDAVNRASEVTEFASGKSINAARVVHALGRPTLATGFLGGDTGSRVRKDLDAAGIPIDFLEVPARTRMCITLLDRSSGQATELVEESHPIETAEWAKLLSRLSDALPSASILVMLGTLAPGAPVDFYGQCIRLASSMNVRTILDAKGPPLAAALPQRPTIVKPNRRELEETIGVTIQTDAQYRDAIRALIERGPQWAVVTSGPDDIVISEGRRFWRIAPPRVTAMNPIGSGDAFAAGIACALTEGADVPQACILGAACAVANALTPLAGHVRIEDVDRLRAKIVLREWL